MIRGHGCERARCPTVAYRAAASIAVLAWVAALSAPAAAADANARGPSPYRIVADGIPEPLATTAGDPGRGRALIIARDAANCVLCHAVPDPAVRFAGDVGPSLAGIGARLSASQLRLRIADNLRVNPSTAMPSYYKVAGLARVAAQYAGKPILTAAEVEDVVAYLATLR